MSSRLEARLNKAFREEGLVDLHVRQTESGGWQCITQYRDKRRRGLCVRGNETDAMLGALDDAMRVRPDLRVVSDEGVFG